MLLNVLGYTRTTMAKEASITAFVVSYSKGLENLFNLSRAWNRRLPLFFLNEECLVGAVHHTALITSLPFVHTARRCYRCWGDTEERIARCKCVPTFISQEVHPCSTSRGSKSRNKVTVGEPAVGSLSNGCISNGVSKFLFTVTNTHPAGCWEAQMQAVSLCETESQGWHSAARCE